jgi:hypothetical protein
LCLLFSFLLILILLSDRILYLALDECTSLFEGFAAEDIEQINIVNVLLFPVVIEVLVFEQIEVLVELRAPNELKLDVPIIVMLWLVFNLLIFKMGVGTALLEEAVFIRVWVKVFQAILNYLEHVVTSLSCVISF